MNKQLDFEPIKLDELEGVLGGSEGGNNGCGITNGKCSTGGCGLFNGKCNFTKPGTNAPTINPDISGSTPEM